MSIISKTSRDLLEAFSKAAVKYGKYEDEDNRLDEEALYNKAKANLVKRLANLERKVRKFKNKPETR